MQVSRGNLHPIKISTVVILIFFIFSFSAHYSHQLSSNLGLSAPILTSPVNNTTWTQSLYPTFQWQSVTGASSYSIQISRSSTNFTGSNLVKSTTVYNTYYIIDTALTNCTSYYWRVHAVDDDTPGSWSSVWKFTVQVAPSQPVLTSPLNAVVLTIRRPTFTWESSSGATAYTIEINGSTYSVSATSFTPFSNLSLGSHSWRVRATSCGGAQVSDWSPTRTFTIDLDDVVLKQPANGATLTTTTPTFEWYPVDGATKYKLEVRTDTISGQKLFEVEVSGTSFTPSAILNPGIYAWHVMSYRNNVWTGTWSSQPFTFTIQTSGTLIAPHLQTPLNGSAVDFPLTLQWSSVTGAYSYTLQYSRDITFVGAKEVTLFGTDYVISSALEEGRWYWRVKANAWQGGSRPWSTVWSFEAGLPVPQLMFPTNGTTQGTSTVTFDWSDVTGSQIGGELYDLDHYVLQYSTSSSFESSNTKTISDVGGIPLRDSRYGPLNLEDNTHYWRVKAVYIKYPDGTLREGSWSTSFSFTISTKRVNIPCLVSPISGSVMRGTSITLAWTAVESSGIIGYVLVYKTGTATNPGNPSEWTQGSYTEVTIPGQTTSSYTITLQENTVANPFYWWSIATVNSSGQKGTFPSPINFSIDNTAPNISVVELVQPVDTTLSTRIPTFTWRIPLVDYQDVASWTLEYASDIQLQQNRRTVTGLTNLSTVISGSYASISYTLPTAQALTNGTWYWHISAADAAGNESAFTAVKSFVVNDQPPDEKIRITVKVSDLNGDPVAGAIVELKKEGERAGTDSTDSSGTVTISNLDSGAYTLEVSAAGYNTYRETVNLSANTTKDIMLYRGAVIHGYVYYDNTRNPAPNVAVRVYEAQTELQIVSDVTDTNGYFIVDNVADDKTYYIIVENYEDQKKQGIIAVDLPTTANAMTIIIKTDGEIIGVVQDETGTPLAGAKVTLRDSQDQFVNSTSTNNIGSFTFKVTPGQYYVEVTILTYDDYKGDIFTVEYKEIKDLGLITLNSKTGILEITVQNGGGPLDATVTVKDAAGNIIDTITVTGGEASVEILTGTYSLEANADKYQSQLATGITIKSGTTVSQDFILTPTLGSIEIYIIDTDGMPIFDAEVFLDSQSEGSTDATGVFTISDVSPGDHDIHIVKEDFRDYQSTWRVNPGETLRRDVTMEKSTNWLHILLAVLAVGAGIVALKFAKSRLSVFTKGKTVAFCPYCGNKIQKNWSTCLYCGANLDKTQIYDDDTRIY